MASRVYLRKQRWKVWLGIAAGVIVVAVVLYTNYLVGLIAKEEQQKVELWASAIKNRAELLRKTKSLFKAFEAEDRKNIRLWADASLYFVQSEDSQGENLYFPTRIMANNTNIPVIIANGEDKVLFVNNYPEAQSQDSGFMQMELKRLKEKNEAIDVSYAVFGQVQEQYLYYDDSRIYQELRATLDGLLESFISETVINAASVPVVFTTPQMDTLLAAGNLEELPEELQNQPQRLLAYMSTFNRMEVELGDGQQYLIFYEDSVILSNLRIFPFIFLAIVGMFLFVAYLLFSLARRGEQNQVWVGMSKETAHQLGTPLSSLMGWLALLQSRGVDPEAIQEMERDVERLQTVADRFSKIGSEPVLKVTDLNALVEDVARYMQVRTRSSIVIKFDGPGHELPVKLNRPLFEWVLENLIRNSIDAIKSEGLIHLSTQKHGRKVYLDVFDSGSGIPRKRWKSIFRPGYTTKKRGWGLGLSLTRRIVESYHKGKIAVRQSEPGKGTTIRIVIDEAS